MDNWIYYATALALIIAVAFIIKKVASCMVKTVVCLVLLAALAAVYFYFT